MNHGDVEKFRDVCPASNLYSIFRGEIALCVVRSRLTMIAFFGGKSVDYFAIKLFHYVGIMLLFLGLGGMLFAAYAGFGAEKKKLRRIAAILHGVGLLFIIITGFTMASRLGFMHGDPPGWIKAKFVIFLIMGFSISLAARWSKGIWFLLAGWIVLGALAASLAMYKPAFGH